MSRLSETLQQYCSKSGLNNHPSHGLLGFSPDLLEQNLRRGLVRNLHFKQASWVICILTFRNWCQKDSWVPGDGDELAGVIQPINREPRWHCCLLPPAPVFCFTQCPKTSHWLSLWSGPMGIISFCGRYEPSPPSQSSLNAYSSWLPGIQERSTPSPAGFSIALSTQKFGIWQSHWDASSCLWRLS